MRTSPIQIMILLLLTSVAAKVLAEDKSKEFILSGALRDCVEFHFPNSMARKPEFHLETHLKILEKRQQSAAQSLANRDGISAIRNFLATNKDELDTGTFCAVKLAGMTGHSEAQMILKNYAESTRPGVSEIVKQYLKEPIASGTSAKLKGQVLETRNFRVTVIEHCEEGVVGCPNVEYRGVRKKDGSSLTLRGTTVMVMCKDGVTPCHIGMYQFKNGEYEYLVYPQGNLTVRRGKKVIVSENGR